MLASRPNGGLVFRELKIHSNGTISFSYVLGSQSDLIFLDGACNSLSQFLAPPTVPSTSSSHYFSSSLWPYSVWFIFNLKRKYERMTLRLSAQEISCKEKKKTKQN